MDKVMRMGVVGMGSQGSRYTRFAVDNPHARIQVVAFMEAVPEIRAKKAADHGLPGYATVEELLDKEKLDAVLIATPDFAHREAVLAAVARGKHVLIEKPFATSMDDALVMYDAIKKAGVKCQVCFQNRFQPNFTIAHDTIASGEIGDPLFINARCNSGGVIKSVNAGHHVWFNHSDVAWFQLSHLCDLASWIAGKHAKRVYATAVYKHLPANGVTTFDVVHASVLHTDDSDAIYEGAWCVPENHPTGLDFKVEVTGTKGYVRAETSDQGVGVTSPSGYKLPKLNQISLLRDNRGMHLDMMTAFTRAVLDDVDTVISAEDALENTAVLVAMHKSIETGLPVEIASLVPAGTLTK